MKDARRFATALSLLAPLTAAYAAPGASIAQCPIERAHYRSIDDQAITAEFGIVGDHEGWPSDLALGIRTPAQKTYWFLFDRGAARYINLISTTDVKQPGWSPPPHDGGARPLGEMHYIAADGRLRIDRTLPHAGSAAPIYILLPDPPEVLARRALPAESVSLSFLKLADCE